MSNKRITDLTELTTPTTDDVFPVVDIATNTTTKVQLGNLPTTTAVTTALATKQDTLVSGTNIKTVNSTSLLGSGNVAVQETLVSGTNIKTLNSTSLLGSGNIVLTANPSGVAGAIQFSNGSAFASDAANLFWDDTNNRLGVGTNVPSATGHFKGSGTSGVTTALLVQNNAGTEYFAVQDNGTVRIANNQAFRNGTSGGSNYFDMGNIIVRDGNAGPGGSISIGTGSAATAKLQIQGSGTTSATTSLLVQNSAGAELFKLTDIGGITTPSLSNTANQSSIAGFNLGSDGNGQKLTLNNNNLTVTAATVNFNTSLNFIIGNFNNVASAIAVINSTTQGFLPPRMTTTQKNAISSPAAGLQVYDTTLNQMSYYNGSSWVNI